MKTRAYDIYAKHVKKKQCPTKQRMFCDKLVTFTLPNLISELNDSHRETTAVVGFNKREESHVSPYSSEAEHLSRKQGVVSSILTGGTF